MKTTRRGFLGLIAAVAPVVAALGVAPAAEAAPLASCHQCEPDSPFPHVVSPAHPRGDTIRTPSYGSLTVSGRGTMLSGNLFVDNSPGRPLLINKHEYQPVVIEPLTIRRSTGTTYVQDLIGRDEPIPPGRYAVSSIKAY